MPRYSNPIEALFAGFGGGLPEGTSGVMSRNMAVRDARTKRKSEDEQRRTAARERFAMSDAGEREGSPAQVMDVFNFLSQPDAQRGSASADLSSLLSGNPQLSRVGLPPDAPLITPNAASGMMSDPIREAFMARTLPRQRREFAPPRVTPPARGGQDAQSMIQKILKESESEARTRTSQEVKVGMFDTMDPNMKAAHEERSRQVRSKHKTQLFVSKFRGAFNGRTPTAKEAQSYLSIDFNPQAYEIAAAAGGQADTTPPPAGSTATRGLIVE